MENGAQAYLKPLLRGLVSIRQGEFTLPSTGVSDSSQEEKNASSLPLEAIVDLSLGRDFFVKYSGSEVRAMGDLRFTVQDGQGKLRGQTALSRGSIKIPFYDAVFHLRQGTAIFEGPLTPRLEAVEAVADMGGYRITARANGVYPETLKLDLYSDPPLPQSELSRLALTSGLPGQFAGGGDPSQNTGVLGSLSNTGVSFLSGILTNRITDTLEKFLFLSELSFDYIPPATYAIKAAKALDPNDSFLLTVTRIIRESGLSENLFGIEWRFTRQLLVRAAFDQLARPRFWLQSINRF